MSGPAFIPYYIDYSVKNVSKTIGASKKRITFKFGFANRQAIDDGLVGAHCRGSEHDLVFIWSLNSGKRQVSLDGKDIHYSTSGQNGWTSDRAWLHVFSLKVPGCNNVFQCHLISQPVPQGSAMRPFDLRIQGVSIFKFNQIYELGTPRMVVRRPGGGRSHYGVDDMNPEEEAMSPEERRLLAAARLESMREYRKTQDKGGGKNLVGESNGQRHTQQSGGGEDLLMSFDDLGPPVPPQQQPNQMVSSLTVGTEYNRQGSFPPQQQQGQQYGYPPQQQQQPHQQLQYGGYNQSPGPGSHYSQGNSATTAPISNTTAMMPYGQPSPGGYSNLSVGGSSFGTAPTQPAPAPPSMASSMDPYAKPPDDPWATPAPAPPANYGQQQPQYGGYPQQQPNQQYNLQSPAAQSYASFGSAPDFARPPPQGQQQQPQYGQPYNHSYAPPPQYQQPWF